MIFPLSPFAPENLVSQDVLGVPSRVNLLILHTMISLSLVLSQGISPVFRDGVHLFIPSMSIGSVPSFSGHALANRWRSPLRVHRRRVCSPQGCSSNGCSLFKCYHGPIDVRLSFSTLTQKVLEAKHDIEVCLAYNTVAA